MHWTLFLSDEDPASDYMYTWPNEMAERRSMLPLTPGAAPENLGALWTADNLPPGQTPATLEELERRGAEHAFRLIPLTGPRTESAKRRRAEKEQPFVDGKTDLQRGVWSRPVFGTAKYEQKFMIAGESSETDRAVAARPEEWETAASRVRDFLNAAGPMRIVTDTDRGWYRLGNCHATVPEVKDKREHITVTAELDPYRYERYHSAEPWLWDDFSFIDGVIREYGDIDVGALTGGYFAIPMRDADVVPEFWNLTGEVNIEEMELPAYWMAFVGACAALRGYIREVIDYDGTGEDPAEGLAEELLTLTGDVRTAFEALSNEMYELPVMDRVLEELDSGAEAAEERTEMTDGERDELLTWMDEKAVRAEYLAAENLIQASTDQEKWYGINFYGGYRKAGSDVSGNRAVLKLEGVRTPQTERILYLRGSGHISVKMRGKTL